MNIFGKKNRADGHELEKLIIALKKVEKPVLRVAWKSAMKERLLGNILIGRSMDYTPYQLRSFGEKIRAIGQSVVLPAGIVCMLKERIMGVVERTPVAAHAGPYSRYFRAAVSGVLLLVFTVTALFSAPFRVHVAHASSFLDEVSGAVTVLRDGRTMEARKDLSIQEGDVILTREGSSVTVHFLDNSISRLGENTGLQINKLYSDPKNPIITRVELFLKGGRLWTRVVNLVDESSVFQVKTQKAVAAVPKKAAFDVQSRENLTRVAVFDNMVDMMPADAPENTPSKTVIAGYQAEVGENEGVIEVTQIAANDPSMQSSKRWLSANMAKDEDYGRSLLDTTVASAAVEDVTEDAGAAAVLLNPEFENEKNYFISHYNYLVKAETMFVRGNRREGSKLLRSFMRGVNNLVRKLPRMEQEDPVSAAFLKGLMKEKIAIQLKDFSGFLPGDELFPVKEALRDVELLLADSEIGRTQLRVSQAESVLLDIQELLKENKISYAAALLNDYQERTAQIILKLDSGNADEFEGKLKKLIIQQARQVKVLTAIEETLAGEEFVDFRVKVSGLRRGSLLKILDTLNQMQVSFAPEVLAELKDIFDTYLADEDDRDIVEPVFAKLTGSYGGLNFIQPDGHNIPGEVGVVMIVNVEATPDVRVESAAMVAGSVSSSDSGGGEQSQD